MAVRLVLVVVKASRWKQLKVRRMFRTRIIKQWRKLDLLNLLLLLALKKYLMWEVLLLVQT